MANKKFSEFTVKTSTSDVDFVVGYDGTDNVRITPANLTGGGGASSLNGLTDCLVDGTSLYVGEVPAGLSGNPTNNTILGIAAGDSLTTGSSNTYIGEDAGKNTTTQTFNTAVGSLALRDGGGTSSSENTAVGYRAGERCTANHNIFFGHSSGLLNTSGSRSSYIGYKAGQFANISDSVVLGYFAGNTASGSNSVYVGRQAGTSNSSAGHISIGYEAGYSQTSGTSNTNVGYHAGYTNTTGSSRTILGNEASKYNVGNFNVAIGTQAMTGNASGSTHNSSVAIGHQAGASVTGGGQATIVGYQAGAQLTSGWYNTFLGAQAGDNVTTGENNIVIGRTSDASSGTVSNEITLGNSSISTLRCAVTSITSLSDERDKSEIKDLEYGLAFIDALQPREFVWNNRVETNKDGEEFFSSNKGKKDFGFIAQEVKELDNDTLRLVYDENPEKLELSYGKLVPVLVQAIKELKAEIELLKS